MARRRLDFVTLAAFAFVVIVGGSNIVGVRLSNRELPPFFGAGLRFFVAALLLGAVVAITRTPLPRGRSLVGAVVFGLLNFFLAFALFYWGLQKASAALGGVMLGAVPLLTFILAVLHRVERFRWRGAIGAVIAVAGVVTMAGAPTEASAPLLYLMALFGGALAAAETAIVIKRFPSVHPFAMNAVGMGIGAVLLLLLSALSGETWVIPERHTTWFALAFLIPVGSVLLFIAYVFVVQRWTASAASYQFVLFPVVAAIAGALIADEALSSSIALGAALVILGTYVGALAGGVKAAPVPEVRSV